MPKKSKKSKSKRMTLKQKYKIIKKVKEHHRKKRKELRGKKDKGPKDPGLPAQWPFKEDLIKEFAWKKQQILLKEAKEKEERKAQRAAAAAPVDAAMGGDDAEGIQQLASLQTSTKRKHEDFEARQGAGLTSEFNSDKDHSRKAFYREFRKVVDAADVVIQVLDARDPLACRCPEVERYIRSTGGSKKIILLLNKMDLVPREIGEQWLKYFREEMPCVPFKCSTQTQSINLKQKKMPNAKKAQPADDGFAGSACLGADALLQLLKNYCRNMGIKTAITVGVIGLPNVGKSSLINSLKRARVAQVGNTPGVTKAVQEIHLDKHIKLLDSPGIVFTNADNDAAAALRNCIKVEKLDDPLAAVSEIMKRVPTKTLAMLYKIGAFHTVEKFVQGVAAVRGKLNKGGTPNMTVAARVILQDWNDGRIPYYTIPPSRGNAEHQAAAVVSSWAADFNADEVFANEERSIISHLPSLDDEKTNFIELPSMGQANVDVKAFTGDDMEDDDVPSTSGKVVKVKSQAQVLYTEDGQFNPHQARAERKKQKKGKDAPMSMGDDGDDEFNFDELNDQIGDDEEEEEDEEEDGEEEEEEEGEDGEEEEEDGSDEEME